MKQIIASAFLSVFLLFACSSSEDVEITKDINGKWIAKSYHFSGTVETNNLDISQINNKVYFKYSDSRIDTNYVIADTIYPNDFAPIGGRFYVIENTSRIRGYWPSVHEYDSLIITKIR